MRTSVQWNDARFVDHFREKHHVPGSLENLIITVRTRAEVAAHPRDAEGDAANKIGQVFRTSCSAFGRLLGGGYPALPGGRYWRKLPIRRIHNQRRSIIELPIHHILGAACGDIWVLVQFNVRVGGQESVISAGEVALAI